MSVFHADERLRLRAIEIRQIDHGGPALLLRDPLQLASSYIIMPQGLGPLLALFDGGLTYAETHALVAAQIGAVSGPALLNELLEALDGALLLENAAYRAALAEAHADYHAPPFRSPTMAGISYSDDPRALRRELDALLDAAGDVEHSPPESRGLLSPHIDYPRGGSVYAQVWKSAAAAARAADLVLLLATDHYSPEPFTLTRQAYATPYGALPTDRTIVDSLAEAIGPDAFAAELYHRSEHSVELVATWLHHSRGGEACTLVPLLCGSFQRFISGDIDPATDPQIEALSGAIRQIAAARRTLIVVSGDLAHVGPAFGGRVLDTSARGRLRAADDELIAHLCAGDAPGLYESIRKLRNRNNVCGLPPAYLALRALGDLRGELIGYNSCPADDEDRSAVTIAGVVFD